jgi:hypothetical protein
MAFLTNANRVLESVRLKLGSAPYMVAAGVVLLRPLLFMCFGADGTSSSDDLRHYHD